MLAVAVAVPLFAEHPDWVEVAVKLKLLFEVTFTVFVAVQPFASVISTE